MLSLGRAQATYQYDGAGQRVARTVNGILTVWVYDALGRRAAEYSSGEALPPVPQPTKQRVELLYWLLNTLSGAGQGVSYVKSL
jgi:hypothetical protein